MPSKKELQLSIILPIYNVEPYLEKCIRSIQNQDIAKDTYEIICVNDGSPDNSQQLVEKLQLEFPNIILLNQKNQGVSLARNNGLKVARGKYILFVDPDDALEKNCLLDLIKYTETNQFEVVFSPFTFVEINGEQEKSKYRADLEGLMDGITLYHAVRGNSIIDPDRSVAILYKRDLFIDNDLKYLKDVPYLEDGEFIARVLCLANRCSVYNKPYYLRLNRPGSATRSNLFSQKKSTLGFLKASHNLLRLQREEHLSIEQKQFLNQPIAKFVFLAVQSCVNKFNFIRFNYVKRELKHNFLLKLAIESVKQPYDEMIKNYNKSVNIFYLQLIFEYVRIYLKIKLNKLYKKQEN